VIIPTYNGGKLFKKIIDRVRRQRLPGRHEIVVIDSSSSDGTAEFCRKQNDIVLVQIAQKDFSHGRTRNQAIELCRGKFVALLTQDAMPTDEFWLHNFTVMLKHYPNAAGAFGKHLAWPDASPFVKRDIDNHFAGFEKQPLCVSRETDANRWRSGDIGWRQFLHFYSDNNSCLRRDVWKKIPYPDTAYGEDQLWARAVIEAGYEKVYSPKSVVYHSHDYDYEETAKRAAIEARFFKENFGYVVLNEEPKKAAAALDRHDEAWARSAGVDDAALAVRKTLNRARMMGYARGQAGKP
jgi:glycosyltransferase involved in cell wall biosynthesis